MKIGRMNQRISIEKSTVIVDAIGNHSTVWKRYFDCYSYASTYAANESGTPVVQEKETVSFSVRYCPETAAVTSVGYRVCCQGKIYNIDSVDQMNYDRKEIRLKCSREVRP